MNYGRAIKIVRTAYGLTQSALAKRLSIGTSQVSLIEAGKRQPSVRVLHEIALALDVPMHLLTLLAEWIGWKTAENERFHVMAMLFWDGLIVATVFHDPTCECGKCRS